MSDPPEATAPTEVDPAAVAPAATEAPAAVATEAPGTETQPIDEAAAEKIRLRIDLARINRLTREKGDLHRQVEAASRERDLYKAMVEGRGAPQDGAQPQPTARAPEVTVEQRAEQLLAERSAETRRQTLVQAGVKEFTPQVWDAKTEVIAQLGATENPAFMRAVVAVPEGHKVVAALADDPDRVASLLRMEPLEMAAEMGRMSAELSAPRPRAPVSAAPAPVAAPTGRVQPTPDIYNTSSMSMKEYAAHRAKTAPPSLGGQRRTGR